MELSSYHQPYSHQTRFKVIHSTTTLIKLPKTNLSIVNRPTSQFKLIRHAAKQEKMINPQKPTIIRAKSIDKPSAIVAKSIGNKYKWMRASLKNTDSNSFKLDHRKVLTSSLRNGRVSKRKPRASLSKCLVRIRGVKFHTNPNGKCLQRLTSDSDTSKILSSSIPVKKVERPTIARANILLQRSIQISNGNYRLRNVKKKLTTLTKKKNCIYFNRFGKCHRGDKCPFIHDLTRIAVCTQFLNGRCKNSSCLYSHELTPGKVPTCSYFIKGACGQDNCPYAHSYVGHDAQICEDFVQGFCAKATECAKQHVLLCPHFESTGRCPRGKHCHLTHRRKRNENNILKIKSKPVEESFLLSSVMPAYIPLNREIEKKSPHAELKLKPSFLS
ncbi:unnamed protein product [Rotaria magnacalcarata]|uniref:C3H1-type domain-containing protein n=1 Tax=Rotaria magnacalcarata TaxID=392030 RepID=A0A816YS27_9BILA|nr:unnamed protein product [Rotaria magnacalcarata]CAF3837324.1 unnamed protein product [Rotaria magnacalcarata]